MEIKSLSLDPLGAGIFTIKTENNIYFRYSNNDWMIQIQPGERDIVDMTEEMELEQMFRDYVIKHQRKEEEENLWVIL